jgi:hypothetical protein
MKAAQKIESRTGGSRLLMNADGCIESIFESAIAPLGQRHSLGLSEHDRHDASFPRSGQQANREGKDEMTNIWCFRGWSGVTADSGMAEADL